MAAFRVRRSSVAVFRPRPPARRRPVLPEATLRPEKRIRVCFVVNNLDVGGLEKVALSLVNRLDRERFDPALVCLLGEGKLYHDLDLPRDRVLVVNKGRRLPPLDFDPTVLGVIAQFLRASQVDVIHAHNVAPLVFGGLARRLAWSRAPLVYSEHNQIYSATPAQRRKFRVYVRLADHVVAVSEDLRASLARDFALRSRVIYNGVDGARFRHDPAARERLRRELGCAEGEFFIGTGVVLSEQKGVSFLLGAARRVLALAPEARFAIAGEGPSRPELERRAAELGLGDRLRFLGYRRDIPEFLSAIDLYVLPSLWEGLPLSLLEALAAGKPVVATAVGGNAEIIEPGVNGWLVPARNEAALADAILRVRGDAALRASAAVRGRERFERFFSVEAMVSAHQRLYAEVARPRLGQPAR
ncbi:MAG: glycosyltransferase [Polyangiaceae bacterium]|nr:glycosyltransferase [Polyangiaceae bacterium]